MKTVFVAGVHGVGKSHLCNSVLDEKIIFESASAIIKREIKSPNWAANKVVQNADANQVALMQGLDRIRKTNLDKNILIDGHFVLKTPAGLHSINFEVFSSLNLNATILITDAAEAVRERILARDAVSVTDDLEEFIALEQFRAQEFSKQFNVPLYIVKSGDLNNFEKIINNCFATGDI